MARGMIETMTAEHDEGRAGPCGCGVCLRGRGFLEMCDGMGVERNVGQSGVVVRETCRVEA